LLLRERHIARENETHDLSQQQKRSRHEDDYLDEREALLFSFLLFFFSFLWCVRTEEFGKPSSSDGSDSFSCEKLPSSALDDGISSHLPHSLPFHTHTHTRSNLFKRYGYEFFCFWRGKHGGTRFYRRTRAFRFASSRSSFEAAIFCASLLLFFLFPSAAKVIFLPPPLVVAGGERRAILASDAKANLSEGREKVIEAFF